MFPYEKNLIDKEMLNTQQKQWINNYHQASLRTYPLI